MAKAGSTPIEAPGSPPSVASTPASQALPPGVYKPPAGRGREPMGATLPESANETANDRSVFQRLAQTAPETSSIADLPGSTPLGDSPAGDSLPAPRVEPGAPGRTPQPGAEPLEDGTAAPDAGAASDPDGLERREAETVARAIFQRDGWKGPRLDAMIGSLSTEDLVAQTQEARARQAEYDRLGNAVHNPPKGGKPGKDQPKTEESNRPEDLSDLTAAQRKLVLRHRELGDDETADAQLEAFREGNEALNRRAGESEASPSQPSMAEMQTTLREPLDRLESTIYPELRDPAIRGKVIEAAIRLNAAGAFDEHDNDSTMLGRAAQVVLGSHESAQRRQLAQHQTERNGTPTPHTRTTPPQTTALNERDADRLGFRELASGMDPRTVRSRTNQRVGVPG